MKTFSDNEVIVESYPDSEVVIDKPEDKKIGTLARVAGETTGALAGEALGAQVGSVVPGIGTLAGGYVGGALGAGSATYGMDISEGKTKMEALKSGAKSAALQLAIPAGIKLGAKVGSEIALKAPAKAFDILGPKVFDKIVDIAENTMGLAKDSAKLLAEYSVKIAGVDKSAVTSLIENPVKVWSKIKSGVNADDLLDAEKVVRESVDAANLNESVIDSIFKSENPYRRIETLLGEGVLKGKGKDFAAKVYDYLETYSAVKFSPILRKMGPFEAIATTLGASAGHTLGGLGAPVLTPGMVLLSPRGMGRLIIESMAAEGTLTHGTIKALNSNTGKKALISLTDELTKSENEPKE